MMRKIFPIFGLYWQNPLFRISTILFLISAGVSRIGIRLDMYEVSDDFYTLMFIMVLWLCFHVGLILKQQFCSPMASLFPSYRGAHILMAGWVYLFFIAISLLWQYKLHQPFIKTTEAYIGGHLIAGLVAIIITFVAYLSIGRVVIYTYIFLLFLAGQSGWVIEILNQASSYNLPLTLLVLMVVSLFVWRLFTVKEDQAEYKYLMGWPAKKFFTKQISSSSVQKFIPIAVYPSKKGLLQRARHWDVLERHEMIKIITLVILTAGGLMVVFRFWPEIYNELGNVYDNFLLLCAAPVLIVLISNQKIAFWDFDLIKPVSRKNFFLERGVSLLIQLLFYWSILIFLFGILPAFIFESSQLIAVKFWFYILLTFSYSILLFAWLAYLSSNDEVKNLLMNGILMAVISVGLLFNVGGLETWQMFVLILASVFAGGYLLKVAHRSWTQKEFV